MWIGVILLFVFLVETDKEGQYADTSDQHGEDDDQFSRNAQ